MDNFAQWTTLSIVIFFNNKKRAKNSLNELFNRESRNLYVLHKMYWTVVDNVYKERLYYLLGRKMNLVFRISWFGTLKRLSFKCFEHDKTIWFSRSEFHIADILKGKWLPKKMVDINLGWMSVKSWIWGKYIKSILVSRRWS